MATYGSDYGPQEDPSGQGFYQSGYSMEADPGQPGQQYVQRRPQAGGGGAQVYAPQVQAAAFVPGAAYHVADAPDYGQQQG